jgi:hypothetical protein
MPKARVFEFEVDTEQLKTCKSPPIDQIPPDLIKGESRKIRPDLLVPFMWRNCLRSGRSQCHVVAPTCIKI